MELRQRAYSRRDIMKVLIAAPVVAVAACQTKATLAELDTTSGNDTNGGTDTASGDAVLVDSTGSDASPGVDTATDTTAVVGWATGGTVAMTALASYPDPFADDDPSDACELTCVATIGPCHTTSPERVDVSDGWDGLPVRLALLVVDEDCQPVEDAIVEIWHTNYRGGYSGRIAAMCNETASDISLGFFRGYQRTDADGRVYFNTCYPGWYSGRVVHIHFRVMTGAYSAADNAAAEVISQLFFPDAQNQAIFSEEPLYSDFGQPDTSLSSDNVVGGESDPSKYLLRVEQMTDGAMLASARIVLRTSSSACSMQGSRGGTGPGARP